LKLNKQVLPGDGIYFTYYYHQGTYLPAMTYIGKRPTINGMETRNETNIINFKGDDASIEKKSRHLLLYLKKIREEKRFDNLEELQKNIYNDKEVILALYQNYPIPDIMHFANYF
jgi:FAD synthase